MSSNRVVLGTASSTSALLCTDIALVGMRFHVCVGILPHEGEFPQPLEVDLTVRHLAARAGVLDYRALYNATHDAVHAGPLSYLEALAEDIASRALALEGVLWCRVALRKPHAAIGGPVAYAQVTVERACG